MSILYLMEFIDHLNVNNFNKNTVVSYKSGLLKLEKYLIKNKINLVDLNVRDINSMFGGVILANATKKVYLRGIIKYVDFLNKHFNFKIDINGVIRYRVDKKEKEELDYNRVKVVLSKLEHNNSPSSQRDFLLITLIMRTGIKISDLVNIKISDFNNSIILINGHKIILDHKLLWFVNNFIVKSRGGIYLFNSLSFNSTGKGLTVRSVEVLIKKYFLNYSYNDLKMSYFKSLLDYSPDIVKISHHESKLVSEFVEVLS